MGDYNIGTKAGNDIAETLKKNLGTSTTVKDGSSWTADKSGNIWVTKDGVTTKANITYQPPNTGSGGSVSGGGGGSGSGTGTGTGTGASNGAAAQPKDWSTPGGSGSSSTVDSAADKRAAYDQQIQDYIRQLQQMQGQKTATAADQSDYIRQMYEQQLAANKAQLENDYNQNVSNLDSEASKIGANYYEQRRQTQANADRSQANYNEMANASGLNSGTGGQAALSRSNQLQSDLTALGNAEAQNRAEIERQRTLLGQQYQNAIQKAQAENNMELAQRLYQEAVRVDESIIDASKNDSNRALEILNMMLNQVGSERDYASQDAQKAADLAAAAGKYGLYGKIYGLSDDVIKRLEEIYNKELADKEAERRLDLAIKAKQAKKGILSNNGSISDMLNGVYR
nr:MAG TPA: Transcription initiation factor TFIID subunit, DNA, Nuclear [Caudoviricetes sp.]